MEIWFFQLLQDMASPPPSEKKQRVFFNATSVQWRGRRSGRDEEGRETGRGEEEEREREREREKGREEGEEVRELSETDVRGTEQSENGVFGDGTQSSEGGCLVKRF